MKIRRLNLSAILILVILAASGCGKGSPEPGSVKDEALTVGRTAESLPAADEDYFKDMDGGVELTVNEVKGRNNWIVWSGGNDRFWDHLVSKSFGAVDLLKILSSTCLYNNSQELHIHLLLMKPKCLLLCFQGLHTCQYRL